MTKFYVFTGPESTGKTTLSQSIASELSQPWVEEYARRYLESLHRKYIKEDLDFIATQQVSLEQKYCDVEKIICDTDLLTLYIWKMEVYLECDLIWVEIFSSYIDRLYLLCFPDIAWQEDPLRENPLDRIRLYNVYKNTLEHFHLPYVEIRGNHDERLTNAMNYII